VPVTLENKTPRIAVDRTGDAEHLQFEAVNECLCAVEFELRILEAHNLDIPGNAVYRYTLQAQSRQQLVQLTHDGAGAPDFRYTWKAILGMPGVPHEPYRAPFAIGASYLVSQALPTRITHDTPEAQYAVDIALPDGTSVYAAREGTVDQSPA
jgi:murein DD-endopeptidase MepM/ murein hydrolase activator NlpD